MTENVYLALGDSMSIDDYTGVDGGGAVSQFHRELGHSWELNDLTFDGCTIDGVPRSEKGNVISLTIGGNGALLRMEEILTDGVAQLVVEHYDLLKELRDRNPSACLIVGNIYAPQEPLPRVAMERLVALNRGIEQNVDAFSGCLADIYSSFSGHEDEYLCCNIEPSLRGATVIASLFSEQYQTWKRNRGLL